MATLAPTRPPTESEIAHEREEKLDQKIDEVFTQTGGFGAWQWFLSVSYWMNNKSIMILILALAYLQKVPKEYFCVY